MRKSVLVHKAYAAQQLKGTGAFGISRISNGARQNYLASNFPD
jgi:hypothetical protein